MGKTPPSHGVCERAGKEVSEDERLDRRGEGTHAVPARDAGLPGLHVHRAVRVLLGLGPEAVGVVLSGRKEDELSAAGERSGRGRVSTRERERTLRHCLRSSVRRLWQMPDMLVGEGREREEVPGGESLRAGQTSQHCSVGVSAAAGALCVEPWCQ